MLKALMQVQKVQQSSISSKWESLLNNLGHTARKLGKLEDALKYHQQALVLKPKSSSTYSAIGKKSKSVREINTKCLIFDEFKIYAKIEIQGFFSGRVINSV